jgi:hypothetical protein
VNEEGEEEGRLGEWQVMQALEGGAHVEEAPVVATPQEAVRFRQNGVAQLAYQVACSYQAYLATIL